MAKPKSPFSEGDLPHLNATHFSAAPEVYRYGSYTIPAGEEIDDHMKDANGLKGLGELGWSICGSIYEPNGDLLILMQRKLLPLPKNPTRLFTPGGPLG